MDKVKAKKRIPSASLKLKLEKGIVSEMQRQNRQVEGIEREETTKTKVGEKNKIVGIEKRMKEKSLAKNSTTSRLRWHKENHSKKIAHNKGEG